MPDGRNHPHARSELSPFRQVITVIMAAADSDGAPSSDGAANFRDYKWLDHVAAVVQLPCPRSNAELAALLDAAVAQDLSCLVKPLPLRRAPGINDMVDIDALLLLTWPVAGGDGRFGAACAHSDCGCTGSAGSAQVDCRASDFRELISELEEGRGCNVDSSWHGDLPQQRGSVSLEM